MQVYHFGLKASSVSGIKHQHTIICQPHLINLMNSYMYICTVQYDEILQEIQ